MRPTFRTAVTGDLVFRPPEGPPASATVTLKEADGTEFRAAVSATGPAVSTTLAAAAVAGAQRIVVASLTGIVEGIDLWVGDSADRRDAVIVKELDSTTFEVTLTRPLMDGQPYGAEVKSGEVSVTLLSAEVATAGENKQAWWTYVVDGTTYYEEQLWDVVLRHFRLKLTPARVTRYVAQILLEQSNQSFDELLDQAQWVIEQRLRWHGVEPQWVVDVTEFERVAGLAIRVLLLDEEVQHSTHRIGILRMAQRMFDEEWNVLMKTRPRWLDRDKDGLFDEGEAAISVERDVGFPDFSGPI